MGRVLNRFTYDMEVVDMTLTEAMSVLMIALGWGVTSIIVMSVILPWMLCGVVPITILYWMLMLHYRKSGADLQRLDAVARSPIQAMLVEGTIADGSCLSRLCTMLRCTHEVTICAWIAQLLKGMRQLEYFSSKKDLSKSSLVPLTQVGELY